MGIRFRFIAERLRNSYWFLPSLMLLGSALLASGTIALDKDFDPERIEWLGQLVYSGGPDGAREVLGTIASSMITVAGVVFSITIVTLQLASSQFGPRMLSNFMRDRGQQLTLGTFVSTFLYSLLVLRAIRSDDPTTVPHLSVTVALLLAVASLSVLIYFIHHVATTIQAPNLIAAISDELLRATDVLFPEVEGDGTARTTSQEPVLPDDFDAGSRPVAAKRTGYVQVLDVERLVDVASEHDLVVRLETRPGRFVVDNTTFALAYPAAHVTDEVLDEIAGCVVAGPRRSAQDDIEFPIKQMVEIAVRALSPGINDPFTANTCVDQLSSGLCVLAGREFPPSNVVDERGRLRVTVEDPVTWDRMVGGAFDQIRQCADFHASVYVHLLESLARIARCVRHPERIEPLVREAQLVLEAAGRNLDETADLRTVRQRYDDLQDVVGAPSRPA